MYMIFLCCCIVIGMFFNFGFFCFFIVAKNAFAFTCATYCFCCFDVGFFFLNLLLVVFFF